MDTQSMNDYVLFDHKDFSVRIKEEMKHIGTDVDWVAGAAYMKSSRLSTLLNGRCKFLPGEIKEIKRIFGFD